LCKRNKSPGQFLYLFPVNAIRMRKHMRL
jgi:hypothetical protein